MRAMFTKPTNVKRWLLVAGAIALVMAVTVACLVRNSGHAYDEAAHRRVAEAAFRVTDADWPAYRDFWLDICGSDKDLAVVGLTMLDLGLDISELALNVTYACPDRLDELPPKWRLD